MQFIFIVVLFSVMLAGCGSDPLDDSGFGSNFSVSNNANYTIELEYKDPNTFESENVIVLIDPGQESVFFTSFSMASRISSAPSPESTFIEFYARALDGEMRYPSNMDLLNNDQWEKRIDGRLTIYHLELRDQDFDLSF